MRKRIFLDTLFVIALMNRRDRYHSQASELSKQFEGHPLLTTDAVLLEIGNALAREYKEEAVDIIEDLLHSEVVPLKINCPLAWPDSLIVFIVYIIHF